MGNDVYMLKRVDETYLKSMQYQLREMTRIMANLCVKDRPPITSRKHYGYEKIIAYKNIRVNALMDNIVCDVPCCSYTHEEVKKLLLLEEMFNNWNLSIGYFAGDISLLKKYDILCNAFVKYHAEKDNKAFAAYKLYELDAIEKHEHISEINELANDIKQCARLEQYDIKYNVKRQKTIDLQKKIEQNSASSLIRSRMTEDKTLDFYVKDNGRFSTYVEIKQILRFAKKFPYVINYDSFLELSDLEKFYYKRQRGINNAAKNENRFNPIYGEKVDRQYNWAKQVVDKVNIEMSKIRRSAGEKTDCQDLKLDETLLKDLELIADIGDKYVGIDLVCEAKSLVREYTSWLEKTDNKNKTSDR